MSKIIFVSAPNSTQALLTEAQVRYYHSDDTIETIDATDKTNLVANIAALTAAQDHLYVAGNVSDSGSFLTDAQLASIVAKLASALTISTWTLTDQSATVNMAYQCWLELFVTPSAPLVIYYTSALDSDLTVTEELYGDYLGYSIVARYFGELTTETSYNALLGLLDYGFVEGSSYKPAYINKAALPTTNKILLTELLQEGLDMLNYEGDKSDDNDFLYFGITIDATEWVGTIDTAAKTLVLELPTLTDLTALVFDFTLSDGASTYILDTIQVDGTTANNFTSDVVYTVVAADGSLKTYTASVTATYFV